MRQNKTKFNFICICLMMILLVACSDESKKTEADSMKNEKESEVEEKNNGDNKSDEMIENKEITDFPAEIPLPDTYFTITDSQIGDTRTVLLEVGEDIMSLIDSFNEALATQGIEQKITLIDDEEDEDRVIGMVNYFFEEANGDEVFIMIVIGEYEEGGALKEGNIGSVSYTINQ